MRWSEAFRLGTNFENHMAAWLAANGYAVSRVSSSGMVAPTLTVGDHQVTLPDLQFMSQDAGHGWLECKWNRTCGRFITRGDILTTGFKSRLWYQYCDIQRVTGVPVWIAFGHREQDEVRLALAVEGSFPGVGAGADWRYWQWDKLRRVASLSEVVACTPAELPTELLFPVPPQQLAFNV